MMTTLATPILFVPPPPPGIVVAAQQEARDLFSSLECWLSSAPALTLPLHLVEQQQQIKGRQVQRATALAGPRSATRHWRRRSRSEGAPTIVLLSIHPPPPPTPYPEYNLWPNQYRPDWL